MLKLVGDVAVNLIASFIFALLVAFYQRIRKSTGSSGGSEYTPGPAEAPGTPTRFSFDFSDNSPRALRREDLEHFGCFFLLAVTVVGPFLIGGAILAIIDTAMDCGAPFMSSDCGAPFITDKMREHGESGYVQYWLGFCTISIIEILNLLLRSWRGRAFGVSLGFALLVFLVLFAVRASRGENILFF